MVVVAVVVVVVDVVHVEGGIGDGCVDANDGKLRAEELYDHKKDPIESVNLANNSDYLVQLERHKKLRNEGWGRVHNSLKQNISAK